MTLRGVPCRSTIRGAAALLAITLALLYRHADARVPERREQTHGAGAAPAA